MTKLYSTLSAALVLGLAGPLAAQDVTDGLVVHYTFEDDLVDQVSGQVAESNGTFSYADGYIGRAINFEFGDNYFLTPEGAVVPGNTSTSYSLLVNHDPTVINTRRQNYLQQLNGDGETGRTTLYLQAPDSPTNPDTIISFVGNGTTSSNYKFTTGGEWFHLGLTIDAATNERTFYVNGVMTNQVTFNKAIEPATGSYIVGHHKSLTNEGLTLDGLMDDLRLYDRVLTADEMRLLAGGLASGVREEVLDIAVTIAPNPVAAGQEVRIDIDRDAFSAMAPVQLRVLDAVGRVVFQQSAAPGVTEVTIAEQLAIGMYTVTLSDGDVIASAKLSIR